MYDAAEKEFLSRPEVEDSVLMNPGSDNADDYPHHVRALAFYLSMMGWQRGQEGPEKPPSRPAVTSEAKKKAKPAGYVEAGYVGELFPST